jgi:hypothetical protein
MMRKVLGSLTALAVTAAASAAFAGTYVSGPLPAGTFGSGAFVAADSNTFKAEQKVAGELSKLAAALSKCYSKGAKNFSVGKADGVAACIGTFNAAGKGATDKYAGKIAKITGIPSCLNTSSAGNSVASIVKAFNPIVLCASPSGAFVDGSSNL